MIKNKEEKKRFIYKAIDKLHPNFDTQDEYEITLDKSWTFFDFVKSCIDECEDAEKIRIERADNGTDYIIYNDKTTTEWDTIFRLISTELISNDPQLNMGKMDLLQAADECPLTTTINLTFKELASLKGLAERYMLSEDRTLNLSTTISKLENAMSLFDFKRSDNDDIIAKVIQAE
jgi:hypothetical protein